MCWSSTIRQVVPVLWSNPHTCSSTWSILCNNMSLIPNLSIIPIMLAWGFTHCYRKKILFAYPRHNKWIWETMCDGPQNRKNNICIKCTHEKEIQASSKYIFENSHFSFLQLVRHKLVATIYISFAPDSLKNTNWEHWLLHLHKGLKLKQESKITKRWTWWQ